MKENMYAFGAGAFFSTMNLCFIGGTKVLEHGWMCLGMATVFGTLFVVIYKGATVR